MIYIRQAACADLDYEIDWSPLWRGDVDSIVTSTYTVPAGIEVHSGSVDGSKVKFWIKGATGPVGSRYEIKNNVKTAANREDCETITVEVV